jgi:hypothetical protein
MRAKDWAALAADVDGAAARLILLKTLYPKADGAHVRGRAWAHSNV